MKIKIAIEFVVIIIITTLNPQISFGQNNLEIASLIQMKVNLLEYNCKIVSEKKAQSIIGDFSFIGSADVEKFINTKLSYIPQIPFSEEELVNARHQRMILILQFPLTMKDIVEINGPVVSDGHLLFYKEVKEDGYWYKKTDFYNQDTLRFCWQLVSRDILPNSVGGKNFIENLQVVVDYIKTNQWKLSDEYNKATDEFLNRKAYFQADGRKKLSEFMHLQICLLSTESPVEVLYRIVLIHQKMKTRLFVADQVITNVIYDNKVVSIGEFDGYFEHSGIHISLNKYESTFLDRGFTFLRKF